MNVIIYPHTHWDREWYMPFEKFRLRLIEVLDDIIESLEQQKISSFYFDGQTIFLEDYLEIRPEKKDLIKKLIKEKKLFVGPFYVLTDEFLPNGEILIRNLELGLEISKEFGCFDFVGYLPDSFGHNSAMPYILKGFGLENAIVWRGVNPNKANFYWQGFQDEKIKTSFLPLGYFHDSLDENTLKQTLLKLKKYYDKTILLPIGADHLNPLPDFENSVKNLKINGFEIKTGSPFEYLKIQKEPKKTIKGELANNAKSFMLKGVYSSRIYLKQQNVLTSFKLFNITEPLQIISEIFDFTKTRKKELEYATKLLLQNQPHDSICGCSHDEVHKEMETRFLKTNQVCDYVISKCLFDISKKYNQNDTIAINPTGGEFSGTILLETDKEPPKYLNAQKVDEVFKASNEIIYNTNKIALTEDFKNYSQYLINIKNIEPFSFSKITQEQIMPIDKELKVTNNSIENSNLKLTLKDESFILQNKKTKETFKNIFEIQDIADNGDSYNFSFLKKDKPIKAEIIGTQISRNGEIQKSLEILHEIKVPECTISNKKRSKENIPHIIKTTISLDGLDDKLVFKTSFKNKSKDHLLRIKISFEKNIKQMYFENNLGLIKRSFDPENLVIKDIKAKKDEELKENSVCFQRFLWHKKFGILTKGIQEAIVEKNSLYLTLTRCTGQISKPDILTRGTPAGPPVLTPEGQCIRKVELEYAFCITKKPDELFKKTNEFYKPVLTTKGTLDNSKQKNIKLLKDFKNNYAYCLKYSKKDPNSYVLRVLNLDKKDKKINFTKDFEVLKIKLNEEKVEKFNTLKADKLECIKFK